MEGASSFDFEETSIEAETTTSEYPSGGKATKSRTNAKVRRK